MNSRLWAFVFFSIIFAQSLESQPITISAKKLRLGYVSGIGAWRGISNYDNSAPWSSCRTGFDPSDSIQHRALITWDISNVPTTAHINRVKMQIKGIYVPASHGEMFTGLFKLQHDLRTLPSADTIWNDFLDENEIVRFHLIEDNEFEYTDAKLRKSVQDAVPLGWMTFGFKSLYPVDSLFEIVFDSVSFEISYVDTVTESASITNVVDGQENYSGWNSFVRAETENFEHPPIQRDWMLGGTYNAEAWFTRFDSLSSGVLQKFVAWDYDANKFLIANSVIGFQRENNNFKAITQNIYPSTLNTSFEGFGDQSARIEFLDPWRVSHPGGESQIQDTSFVEHTTPYRAESDSLTYGVFLDRTYTLPPFEYTPYYSIRCSKYLDQSKNPIQEESDLSQGDWVLQIFENTGSSSADIVPDPYRSDPAFMTRALIFRGDSSSVTAKYKAHLFSINGMAPTRGNNQRKIQMCFDSVYHAVYESDGEVYSIESSDFGAHWGGEQRISDGLDHSSSPCIAALSSYAPEPPGPSYPHSPLVVYKEGDSLLLKQKRSDDWVELWSHPVGNSQCSPVLETTNHGCAGEQQTVVVWNDGMRFRYAMLSDSGTMRVKVNGDSLTGTWTGDPSSALAITKDFWIAWNDKGVIRYLKAERVCGGIPSWTNRRAMSLAYYDKAIGAPTFTDPEDISRTSAAYEVLPVWRLPPPDMAPRWEPEIHIKAWQETLYFNRYFCRVIVPYGLSWHYMDPGAGSSSSFFPASPSVGAYWAGLVMTSSDMCRAAYNYSPNRIDVARLWLDSTTCLMNMKIYSQSDGCYPSLAPEGIGQATLRELYSGGASSPFNYSLNTTGNNLSKCEEIGLVKMREAIVMRDSAFARIGIASASKVEGSSSTELELRPCADTLWIGDGVMLEDKLKFETFSIGAETNVSFDFGSCAKWTGLFSDSAKFTIKVIDAGNGQVLWSEGFPFGNLCGDSLVVDTRNISLSQYDGRTAYLTISVTADIQPEEIGLRENYIYSDVFRKQFVHFRELQHPSSDLTLDQNYPNPVTCGSFSSGNRSTEISYSIPTDGFVRLEIFDCLGRSAAVIVNESKRIGRHSVTFDASRFPSGIYYYRLSTEGKSITRKMSLLK